MVDKKMLDAAMLRVQGWARRIFWPRESFIETSNGATSAGLPPRLNRDGLIDQSMLSGTDLAEYIADTVGAMVTGNTETGIAVTYQDSDNTLDFDAQTAGDARYVALTGNQNVAGVKTFTNGISLGNETLSVYDTGTWTPTITGSGSDPTVTYTTQTGRYQRLGNKVDYNIVVVINTISGGSGDARISLPFTDGTTSGCPGVITFAAHTIPGTPINVVFRTQWGQAYGRILAAQNTAQQTVVQISDLTAATDTILIQGVYFL